MIYYFIVSTNLVPIILIGFIGLMIFSFLLVFSILNLAFNRRSNPNPYLKYFTIEDFPQFEMDAAQFLSRRGLILSGGFYYDDRQQPHRDLVIFAHGIGAGHQAYTHLIMEFVKQGYIVFAYDNTGCAQSQGKAIRGIPQAIEDLEDALKYLSHTTYRQLRWSLIGHSWGAYAGLRIDKFKSEIPIHRVISIAPLNQVEDVIIQYLPFLKWFRVWIRLLTWLKFKALGSYRSATLLKRTAIPTLVILGEKDDDVRLDRVGQPYQQAAAVNPRVEVFIAQGHRHNPYLSFAAEAYVIDTILKGSRSLAKESNPEKRKAFYQQLDYQLVGTHDPIIINKMLAFLK